MWRSSSLNLSMNEVSRVRTVSKHSFVKSMALNWNELKPYSDETSLDSFPSLNYRLDIISHIGYTHCNECNWPQKLGIYQYVRERGRVLTRERMF